MAETKNLCAQIDLALHTKVSEEKEKAGQTTRRNFSSGSSGTWSTKVPAWGGR